VAVAVEVTLEQAASGTQVEVEYELIDRCEHCNGNGAEPGTPIETCRRCEGVGQLRMVSRTAFGQLVRTQACDVCGGDGKVPQQPCAECAGRGRKATSRVLDVDIPAGIADEQRIRVTGRGHAGERGGPPGDLYVLVQVAEDERFIREGNDLITPVDVAAPYAARGTVVAVPTLEGDEEVDIPAGTQPGTVITLRGRGMPSLRRGRPGDQHVVVNVLIPRNLSEEQRQMLEEFGTTLGELNLKAPEERDESIFARVRRALR
jgi:molecular chaperone DnaJ